MNERDFVALIFRLEQAVAVLDAEMAALNARLQLLELELNFRAPAAAHAPRR